MNTNENTQQVKKSVLEDLEKRVQNKVIEPSNYALLKKLIENADTADEAIKIAELGTTYKRTGFHFDKRLEKPSDSISYFKKNTDLSFTQNTNDITHKLIIGDNYPALLNLLIEYRGKVDVIYIDPPYGKDSMGEYAQTNYENAITRDNLLSMLYPRLVLAKQLLSDSGVIFCSIDDRNQAYVKGLFDEVFEEKNFIENFIWIKNSTKNLSKTTSTNHEYILCYCKNKNRIEELELFRKEKEGLKDVKKILLNAQKNKLNVKEVENLLKNFYKNNPQLKGISMYDRVEMRNISGLKCLKVYRLDNISAPKSSGKATTYEIIHPITGLPCKYPTSGWRFTRETMQEMIKNNLIEFYDDEKHVPAVKRFLDTVETEVIKSTFEDFTEGKKELMALFNGVNPFDNPKPTTLIMKFIKLIKNGIILDFFAGSGTTGQAVLELNKQDGGTRQFILCQMNEITDTTPNGIVYDVTSKRLKRAMTGKCYDGSSDFEWNKKNTPLGGNLDVYNLATVANFETAPNKTAFDVIDETLYGQKKFSTVQEKVEWVCAHFEHTQKQLEAK